MGRHTRNRTPREEATAALNGFLSDPSPHLESLVYILVVMLFLTAFLIQASLVWLDATLIAYVVFILPVGSLYRRAYGTETTWYWYLKALAIALGFSAALSIVVLL